MASQELKEKQLPCCSLCLVLAALLCHTCVLIGNLKTASVMNDLGQSTRGWSRVGLGLAKSLELELDYKMNEVAKQLLDSLSHIAIVQDAMEVAISAIGNETDSAVSNATELIRRHKSRPSLSTLQVEGPEDNSSLGALVPVISATVHKVMQQLHTKVTNLLQELLDLLRPALKQVSEWLRKFGDTIQDSVEAFSITLDRVQKIFDQLMQQLNGHGDNFEQLLNESIALFNIDNVGDIDVDDLHMVADLYSITAFKEEKAEELVAKYDDSGDGELQREEMGELLQDPSVPDLMSVVLRTYARRMSEVGGNVKAARMRDEVALAVSQYLGLVCAKNMTRASWIADALTNDTLSLEFVTDLLAQMCLNADKPDQLTSASIGDTVVGLMYGLQPARTLQSLDLMANTTFWVTEGFNADDQPGCVQMLTEWITHAELTTTTTKAPKKHGARSVVEMLAGPSHGAEDREALLAMPATARRLAQEGVALHKLEEQRTRQKKRSELFTSSTSQALLAQLLGGAAPGDGKTSSSTLKAVGAGILVRPVTLEWASWLANNATDRADDYQHECFEYSSQSSSAIDTFATQIQGMVGGVEGFLSMMMKYSTPGAINRLEQQVQEFTDKAVGDVLLIVEEHIVRELNHSMPLVEGAVRHAAHEAGERLGRMIGDALGTPMGKAMKEPLQQVVSKLADDSPASERIGEKLGETLAVAISNLSSSILADEVGGAMEDLVVAGLKASAGAVDQISLPFHLGLVQKRSDGLPAFISGVWEKMVQLLKKLVNMLPTATSTLKFARTEVSKLYSNLNSIFLTFENKGGKIFDGIASLWRILWIAYFVFFALLQPSLLFYAFWSNGYFGGPKPLDQEEEEAYRQPSSLRHSCHACLRCCTMCMKVCHDTQLCLWSLCILLQVIALLIFVVSIALCIIGGVKAFIVHGCAQIYVVNDNAICRESLLSLRDFLSSFVVEGALTPLEESCSGSSLLACELISKKMMTSTMLTTIFSLLGTLLALQLIFDAARHHEQARYRRYFAKKIQDEESAAAAAVAEQAVAAPGD